MRSIFLAVLLLLAVPLHASQQVMQPTDAYFAVIVDDVDAAASWYAHAFGLEELSRLSEEGSYDILNLGNDTLLVDLLWLADGAERPARHTHGFFKAGFFVADLAAFKASLPEDVALSNELAQAPRVGPIQVTEFSTYFLDNHLI